MLSERTGSLSRTPLRGQGSFLLSSKSRVLPLSSLALEAPVETGIRSSISLFSLVRNDGRWSFLWRFLLLRGRKEEQILLWSSPWVPCRVSGGMENQAGPKVKDLSYAEGYPGRVSIQKGSTPAFCPPKSGVMNLSDLF